MKDKLKVTNIKSQAKTILAKLSPYSLIIFLVFVGVIYMYMILSINNLTNAEPTDEDIAAQVKTSKTPRLDEETANAIKMDL